MRFKLSIFPAAIADVDAATQFIARDNLSAALRFYDSVESTYRQIRDHPKRLPALGLEDRRLTGLRRCAVANFKNYLVFYRIVGNMVQVIRVLHGARDLPSVLLEEWIDD